MVSSTFGDVKKFKTIRKCRGCGERITVDNGNRYFCERCRPKLNEKEDNS